ncbi:predicted protein [Uncinocarpus reesii 1704]|uniref:Uncharacterized protein n=1 Tax=Uncinocarpus reesii (strain UAMH 1704) TaxID=336963 RepID=C4JG54_UNCRE|nr:uncharacterized protein UREG_02452 [Uncinocarpus reesii 1704]EEP77603.1 predicted protein [Uncinocarpus reesii 1704]
MPPAVSEASTLSISSTRPTHLYLPVEPHQRSQQRPSSWSARFRESFFSRPDSRRKRKFRSRDSGYLRDQAPMSQPKDSKPQTRQFFLLKNQKGKGNLATIGEKSQLEHQDFASDAGTIRKTPQCEITQDADNPLWPAKSWTGRSKRKHTISRDDYLTARGANPRTGVISPSITSHSDDSDIAGSEGLLNNEDNAMDKKWRLKGDQWISLDKDAKTPLPSPSTEKPSDVEDKARSYIRRLQQRGVRHSQVEDRFVVNMPSAREPCPPTMTTQQISEFQKAIDRIYKNGEKFVDPKIPLTPPEPAPNGPSTPPKKLSKDIKYGQGEPDISRPPQMLEQEYFLGGGRAKAMESRKASNPSPPSTIKEGQGQNRLSMIGEKQMENIASTRNRHSRICSSSLLERRIKGGTLLTPTQDPISLLCPKANPQEAASTIITTTANLATHSPKLRSRSTELNPDTNPSLTEERGQPYASAFRPSRSSPGMGFVAVNRPGYTNIAEDDIRTTNTLTDGSTPTLVNQGRNLTLRDICYSRSHATCLYAWPVLPYTVNILVSCFRLILKAYRHFLAASNAFGTTEPCVDVAYSWINYIPLALLTYVIWKALACIITFGLHGCWITKQIIHYGGYTSGLFLLFRWVLRSKYGISFNP